MRDQTLKLRAIKSIRRIYKLLIILKMLVVSKKSAQLYLWYLFHRRVINLQNLKDFLVKNHILEHSQDKIKAIARLINLDIFKE